MKIINQKGQATLLAILIITTVAIVTAVGVSSRQNSALKRSSYTKQTDQGFACANSAVDVALLCIRNDEANATSNCSAPADTQLVSGDSSCVYEYSVANYTPNANVTVNTLNYPNIQKDTVLQLNTSEVNNIKIKWDSPAFLEVSHIYLDGSTYKMDKYLLKRNGDTAPTGVNVSDSKFSNCTIGVYCSFSIADKPNSIIRIHPYFVDAINVQIQSTDSTFNSIAQGLKITAKGTAGAVVRNLEVIRTAPQLPAIFDYVLYSEEGSITK